MNEGINKEMRRLMDVLNEAGYEVISILTEGQSEHGSGPLWKIFQIQVIENYKETTTPS